MEVGDVVGEVVGVFGDGVGKVIVRGDIVKENVG